MLALAVAGSVQAQSSIPLTLESLAQRLQALEQREGVASAQGASVNLVELDRRLILLEQQSTTPRAPVVTASDSGTSATLKPATGLSVKGSGGLEIKVRGLVQGDGRFFINDEVNEQSDGWLLRRVRPTLEGTLGPLIGFRLTPEFAGDSATVVDAYLDLKFDPRATVRLGKVKGPVGLERLQSASAIALIERGFPTELSPNRDLGVQLQGALAGERLNYVLGAYNGTADGRDATSTNTDGEFEWAGRVFAQPWEKSDGALRGLGFGVAGSIGDKSGAGNAVLPRYRSPGQVQIFNYRANVIADGEHSRWSPQGYYYNGPFGVLGEYIRSSQAVALPSGPRDTLDHAAWQVVGGWVLTGEAASYRGVAAPNNPFAPGGAGWGAMEVGARYGELRMDEDAFPLFADPALVAFQARSWGVGLNWYLTGNFKLVANVVHTQFDGAGAPGSDREDETLFNTRAQFSF